MREKNTRKYSMVKGGVGTRSGYKEGKEVGSREKKIQGNIV